jgi:alcohol dehydrogenase YqhD (iron-dependent ADH family)
VHVAEQYFVAEDGGILRDYFCESVFKTVMEIAKPLLDNPKSEKLRMESFWAGNIALSRFLMKGIHSSGDWSTHTIEHQFSAINDMPHGAGLAIVFPAWLEVVSAKKPNKVTSFFKNVFNISSISEGIKQLRIFFESLNVPTYLSDDSIKEDDISKIVENSIRNKTLGNYVKLNKDDVKNIIKICLRL